MKFFFTLIGFLVSINIVFCQWKNATPYSGTITDICFTDNYTGYATLTSSQIGNCSNTQSLNIYKTIDQGENWFLINTGINASLSCIYFVDSYKAWAGNANNLFSTTDGGQTWIQFSGSLGTGVNDIAFTSAQNGILIGNNGAIRKTTNGGSSWQFITSGVTSNLNKIFFLDTQLGFIACQNGQLLRTTNGGTSWSIINTGSGSLRDVYFLDSNNGYSIGYVGNGYSVLKSNDGGLTWNVQQALTIGGYPLNKLTFSSSTHGYIASGGRGVFRTIDGGNTWTQTETFNTENDNWQGITFIDNNIGFVCGDGGKINKTTDAGVTWKSSVCGSNTAFFSVWATDKKTAYVGGSSGIIAKTNNGGLTWKQKTKAFPNSSIYKVYFASDSLGFACSDSGRILKTIDAGEHWNLKPTNSLRNIFDFSFLNKDTGFASADGGIVFKTINGGETWDSLSIGPADNLKGIFFVNKDTGFVIGTFKIYRTYNAGSIWIETALNNASYLTDIVFTNDSLGYCVGGFGKLLFTVDAGLNWYPTNNMSTNAEIEEISAVNDSVLYFARYTSQNFTLDSGKVIGSQSTACLFNNYSMHGISMKNNGNNGYCTGGINKNLVHIKEPLEIETIVSSNAYCSGNKIMVACIARGYYSSGNIINIELSDGLGNFSNPTIIGSYTPLPFVYQSGIATATLPSSLPQGFYRIRAVSTNPIVIGEDNGFDIIINNQATPSLSLQSNISGPTCAGTNFTFTCSAIAAGLDPNYQWFVDGLDINNNSSVYNTDTLQDNQQVQVILNSSLACVSTSVASSTIYTANISQINVSAGKDITVCAGVPFQLNATGGVDYSWNNGNLLSDSTIANPTAIANDTTTFKVMVTDANNCSNIDSVMVYVLAQPIALGISLQGSSTICFGDSVELIGNMGGIWNNGETSPNIFVSEAGNYFVSSSNSCGSVNSNSIFVTINPLPIPSITFDNNNLISSTASSYQWYFNGNEIIGANSQSYAPLEDGSYSVEVIDSLGCRGISENYSVLITNIKQNLNSTIFIMPNPTNDFLQINGLQNQSIQIQNSLGEIIYTKNNCNPMESIDVSKYANGIYFVKVNLKTQKFIKI